MYHTCIYSVTVLGSFFFSGGFFLTTRCENEQTQSEILGLIIIITFRCNVLLTDYSKAFYVLTSEIKHAVKWIVFKHDWGRKVWYKPLTVKSFEIHHRISLCVILLIFLYNEFWNYLKCYTNYY